MPMVSQPKSSAIRSAAMYILHWSRTWSSVRSASGLGPVANFMPRSSSQLRTAQSAQDEFGGEIIGAQSAVGDSGLGNRGVQIQHPDQPWPLSAPVGDSQNRSFVSIESMQNMVAVLPDGLDHYQRGFGRQRAKN